MDVKQPRQLPAAFLVAGASAWMATAGNAALWRELQSLGIVQGPDGWLLTIALVGILAASLYALLSLFAWRPLLKPVITLLFVASAVGGYFMWTYRIVIDGSMAINTLHTDRQEVMGLLSPRLAAVVLLGAALPSWLVWRTRVLHRPWKQQTVRNLGGLAAGLVVVVALIAASFEPFVSTMRHHSKLRYLFNPLNQMWAFGQAAVGEQKIRGPVAPLGRDARLAAAPGAKPRLLVVVVGETARSINLGINGYERDTTPRLAGAGVVSFRNAWSCGTSTATSVPCMFSHLGREDFSARDRDSENLLDVLQHAGLGVQWIGNQPGGCKGVCDRVPNVHIFHPVKRPLDQWEQRFCPIGECMDEMLLVGLDERIAQLPPERRGKGVVLVLHQIGSHGPRYARFSPPGFKKFMPECTSNHLPSCSPESLRNAYDNTIHYTDHVLGGLIDWLRRRTDYDGAMLYVSDHGESLGENNLYLHGLPYAIAPDVQKHVPWVTWLSPGFEQRSGLTMHCLRGRADTRISHDNLFHTVLGLMQVSTSAYRRDLDAYAGCGAD